MTCSSTLYSSCAVQHQSIHGNVFFQSVVPFDSAATGWPWTSIESLLCTSLGKEVCPADETDDAENDGFHMLDSFSVLLLPCLTAYCLLRLSVKFSVVFLTVVFQVWIQDCICMKKRKVCWMEGAVSAISDRMSDVWPKHYVCGTDVLAPNSMCFGYETKWSE